MQTLKSGTEVSVLESITAQVEATVKTILADVRREGDAAVRRYSESFDRYNPETFRLSQTEIDAAVVSLTPDELGALQFSLEQITRFAKAQRASMSDLELTSPCHVSSNPSRRPEIPACPTLRARAAQKRLGEEQSTKHNY